MNHCGIDVINAWRPLEEPIVGVRHRPTLSLSLLTQYFSLCLRQVTNNRFHIQRHSLRNGIDCGKWDIKLYSQSQLMILFIFLISAHIHSVRPMAMRCPCTIGTCTVCYHALAMLMRFYGPTHTLVVISIWCGICTSHNYFFIYVYTMHAYDC